MLLFGLYLVVSGIYYAATNKTPFNTYGWIFWTIGRVFGLVLIYFGYIGITAPPPTMIPTIGGRRRY
jgi:hypothetical protein